MTPLVLTWTERSVKNRAENGEALNRYDLHVLTRSAREYASSAMWHARVAIERGPTHQWAETAAMFTEDAVAYARVAFHFARLRLETGKAVRS